MTRSPYHVLALLLVSTLPVGAIAAGDIRVGYEDTVTGFSMDYANYDTDLVIQGAEVETDIEKLGVTFRQALGRNLSGDIELGYLATFQPANPFIGSNKQYGEFIGLALNGGIPLTQRLTLGGRIGYAFNRADGDIDTVETEMNWRETTALAYLTFRLPAVALTVGAHGQNLDGDLSYAGPPSETYTFDEATSTGAYAGLDLFVSGTGRISIYANSGDRSGFTLNFGVDY